VRNLARKWRAVLYLPLSFFKRHSLVRESGLSRNATVAVLVQANRRRREANSRSSETSRALPVHLWSAIGMTKARCPVCPRLVHHRWNVHHKVQTAGLRSNRAGKALRPGAQPQSPGYVPPIPLRAGNPEAEMEARGAICSGNVDLDRNCAEQSAARRQHAQCVPGCAGARSRRAHVDRRGNVTPPRRECGGGWGRRVRR
jgi:hypothetical protein